MSSIAILLAAGSAQRMEGRVEDKILAPINGQPALVYSLKAFDRSCVINSYLIVYRDEIQKKAIEAIIAAHGFGHLEIQVVLGGAERQLSVMKALNAIEENCDYVFIHDCARPCITTEAIKDVYAAVQEDQAASLAHPVVDTIKRTEAADDLRKLSLEDLDRSQIWAMETPQAFALKNILKAYQNVIKKKLTITDDTAALATIDLKTTLVPNKRPNPKLTTPTDLSYIEHLLKIPNS